MPPVAASLVPKKEEVAGGSESSVGSAGAAESSDRPLPASSAPFPPLPPAGGRPAAAPPGPDITGVGVGAAVGLAPGAGGDRGVSNEEEGLDLPDLYAAGAPALEFPELSATKKETKASKKRLN